MKQTVMTSVYGVTYIGARDQIKRRLRERSVFVDDSQLFGASCYAAKVRPTNLTLLQPTFFNLHLVFETCSIKQLKTKKD